MRPVCRIFSTQGKYCDATGLYSPAINGFSSSPSVSVMRQLFNVVHQAEQMPLRIDLGLATQGESVQALVITQVAKHRLDGGHALPVQLSSERTVDRLLHPFDKFDCRRLEFLEQYHLPDRGARRMAQALRSLGTRSAIAPGAAEFMVRPTVNRATAAIAVELFACRANTGIGCRIVGEILGPESFRRCGLP